MRLAVLAVLLTIIVPRALCGEAPDTFAVAPFSAMAPGGEIDGWSPMTFKKIEAHTRYQLVDDAGRTVLMAQSQKAASGMIHPLTLSLDDYPILAWRWKVANVLEGGDVRKKSGDDYPARIYITFSEPAASRSLFERAKFAAIRAIYGQTPPSSALAYIWANRAPKGSIHPNPFTDRVMMIAVESGADGLGQWHTASRNLLADYRAAFGENPPPVSGVAVMTDTDNTGGSAVAWFGDIRFERR